MKKHLLLITVVIASIITVRAQIPNASFENWTGNDPDGWFTANSPGFHFVTQSSTAHDGSFAAQCNVVDFGGTAFAAPFALGNNGFGAFTATAPEAVHGWYIFNSAGGDAAFVSIGMYDNAQYTGSGFAELPATSVYKEFIANMYYTNNEPEGDSIQIFFIMGDTVEGLAHVGTVLTLDDLTYGALSGVDEVNVNSTTIETISPNPAQHLAEIVYYLSSPGTTQMKIYDMNGRLINTLLDEKQFPGRYKVNADVSSLAAGTYLCRLITDSHTEVRKIQVVR